MDNYIIKSQKCDHLISFFILFYCFSFHDVSSA